MRIGKTVTCPQPTRQWSRRQSKEADAMPMPAAPSARNSAQSSAADCTTRQRDACWRAKSIGANMRLRLRILPTLCISANAKLLRVGGRLPRRLSRRWLINFGFLRGMAGVIDRLGTDVLRFERGSSRIGARFELDADDHVSDTDGVTIQQDALAKSRLISVDESSVLTRQIADSERVIVQEQHAVVPADRVRVEDQVTVGLAAENEFASRNLKCLPAIRPGNDGEGSLHLANSAWGSWPSSDASHTHGSTQTNKLRACIQREIGKPEKLPLGIGDAAGQAAARLSAAFSRR